jgi:hypothetical protein
MSEEGEYNVGYKRPPRATRFKKGQSGNPSGRPKKVSQEIDPGLILQSVDNEEIVVIDNGKRKQMMKAEVQFRQLFVKAIKGDLNAARLVANMAAKYFAPEAKDWAKGLAETKFIIATEVAQPFSDASRE